MEMSSEEDRTPLFACLKFASPQMTRLWGLCDFEPRNLHCYSHPRHHPHPLDIKMPPKSGKKGGAADKGKNAGEEERPDPLQALVCLSLLREKKVPSHASTALKRIYAEPKTNICQLQILADSFEPKFEPFTLEKPRCLLPLANTPLIEYTLEFLANAGVEEVFICCGNHTEQVEAYVAASKWTRATSPFSVEIVRSSAAHSIGDAMRDMDQKGILTGDFVCVYGDVVASVGIESAIRAQAEEREE